MEYFDDLILGLPSFWGQRLKSILVDSSGTHPTTWCEKQYVESFGQVTSNVNELHCCPAIFQPFKGVELLGTNMIFQLAGNVQSDQFPVGAWIGFNNVEVRQIHEETIKLNAGKGSNIWVIAEHQPEFPVNFTNVFCGAFCGWERAIQWMQTRKLLTVQRSISLDTCEQTMKIWQLRTKAPVVDSIEQINSCGQQQLLGIRMEVANDQWLNAVRAQCNHAYTGSPPCQSWCKGGSLGGLAHENGMAFVDFIQKAKQTRPNIICVECADSITQHPHYALLKKCFEYAGFGFYWSDIVQYEHLSAMYRTRWLAIWIRNGLQVDGFRGRFRLADVHRKGWNDDTYCFAVSDQIQHQLTLRTEQSLIYGAFKFLPQGKKSAVVNKDSVDAVLKARCIKNDQFLPTLVASYSQQHTLAMHSLESKGIYASLVQSASGFAFVDPLRFASLLGAVCGEIIPLPVKIEYSFRNLGNAISVPQALLTILVGLSALKFVDKSIVNLIRECWNDRVTTHNSIVCRNRDFAFIVPHALVAQTIAEFCIRECIPSAVPQIVAEKFRFQVGCNETIGDFLRRCGIDFPKYKGLCCMHEITQIPWSFTLQSIAGKECIVMNRYRTVFRFTCIEHATFDDIYECDSLDRNIEDIIEQIEDDIPDEVCPTIPYQGSHEQDGFLQQRQHEQNETHATGSPLASVYLEWYEVVQWDHFRNCISKIDDVAHRVVFTDGRKQVLFHAITKLPCDSVAARLPFFDPQCSETFDVHEITALASDKSCVFVASEKQSPDSCMIPIVIHDNTNDVYIAKNINKVEIPWTFVSQVIPSVTSIKINDDNRNSFIKTSFQHGDLIRVESKKRKNDFIVDEKFSISRASRFYNDGIPLASDELQWIFKQMQLLHHDCHAVDPTNLDGAIASIMNVTNGRNERVTFFPILHEGHWCACEFHHGTNPRLIALNFRNDDKACICDALKQVGYGGPDIEFAKSPVLNGFCGWVLLHGWCRNHPFIHSLQSLPDLEHLTGIKAFEVVGSCPKAGPEVPVWTFAARVRLSFLKWHTGKTPSNNIVIGSANPDDKDATMSTEVSDPIFENDAWAPPKDKKMCKWEDLKMPNDHYFKFTNGEQIQQMHRQQLNNNVIGIAFGTKSHVVSLFTAVSFDPCK